MTEPKVSISTDDIQMQVSGIRNALVLTIKS